jgi:ABC-type multidrug transport system fused ATPase/permease subunit
MLQLVFQPLQELSELYGQVQSASAAMTKISSVLDAEHDIMDRDGAPEMGHIAGRLELVEPRGRYTSVFLSLSLSIQLIDHTLYLTGKDKFHL